MVWHARGAREICAVAILLLAILGSSTSLSCESWDFDEEIELADALGKVNGLGLKYHPRNPLTGLIDFDTYLAWRLGNFEETDSQAPMWSKCDVTNQYPSQIGANVWRAMLIGDLDCTVSRGYRTIQGNINQTYVQVNATWSTHPDFFLQLEVQAVSSNYSMSLGTGPLTDGYEYLIQHTYVFFFFFFLLLVSAHRRKNSSETHHATQFVPLGSTNQVLSSSFVPKNSPSELKTVVRVENWPWGGDNGTTFLVPSFLGAAQSPDGKGNLSLVVGVEGSYLQIQTERFLLKQNMTHFVELDGAPVLKTFDPVLYNRVERSNETPISFFIPFGLCRANDADHLPHWDRVDYDPQFSSLFIGGGLGPEAPNPPPRAKSSNQTVAIAAGTTFAVVGAGVAAITLYMIFGRKEESIQSIATRKANAANAVSSSTGATVTRQ